MTISITALATVAAVSAVEDVKETDIFEQPPALIGDEALMELLIPSTPVQDAYDRRIDVKDDRITELKDVISDLEKEVDELNETINDMDSNEVTASVRSDSPKEGDMDESDDGGTPDTASENTETEKGNEEVAAGQTFEATYYSALCSTGCTGVTASGLDVSNTISHEGRRIIAADPSVLPLGTAVKVSTPSETFEATVQDTGGDIKGNRVDILVESEEEAYSIGRHNVNVEIIE